MYLYNLTLQRASAINVSFEDSLNIEHGYFKFDHRAFQVSFSYASTFIFTYFTAQTKLF